MRRFCGVATTYVLVEKQEKNQPRTLMPNKKNKCASVNGSENIR